MRYFRSVCFFKLSQQRRMTAFVAVLRSFSPSSNLQISRRRLLVTMWTLSGRLAAQTSVVMLARRTRHHMFRGHFRVGRFMPDLPTDRKPTHIIVGAGAAGCVLVCFLSVYESNFLKVCIPSCRQIVFLKIPTTSFFCSKPVQKTIGGIGKFICQLL